MPKIFFDVGGEVIMTLNKGELYNKVRKWLISNRCPECKDYLLCFAGGFTKLEEIYEILVAWRQNEASFKNYECPGFSKEKPAGGEHEVSS